jgi:hypothetical protein
MAGLTFLQSPALVNFVYPFLLVFFILFAVLEKTKVLGEKKQINAFVALIIGFIFVSAIFPKVILANLMLFLVIAIVIVLVILLIWGFIMGSEGLKIFTDAPKGLKAFIGVVIIIAVVFAVFWAAGIDVSHFFNSIWDKLFHSSWSDTFWANFFFVVLVAAALAVVLGGAAKAKAP